MRILVNATVPRRGGALQKAVEFVRASTCRPGGHQFFYALSTSVAENLRGVAEVDGSSAMVTSAPPSHPLRGAPTRRTLHRIQERFRPDVVFTVLGPAYMTFRSPHLVGFANAWVTHPSIAAWRTLPNPLERARFWAWCRYVGHWIRFANRWLLESEVAADRLARFLGRPRELFHVIPNVAGGIYEGAGCAGWHAFPGTEKQAASDVNVLVFSHYYPHKNLEIVPWVALAARRQDPSRRYRFLLTFDRSQAAWTRIQRKSRRLKVEENVINLGPVRICEGPRLYGSVDVVFLPSLLETSPATFPEAMICRKPIVTTDLPFSHDLCGDAALFFASNDAVDAASKILALARCRTARDDLIRRGVEHHMRSTTRQEAYEMLLDVLELTCGVRATVPEPSGARLHEVSCR